MAEIHIRREHRLGLAKARKTAWRWAELAEQKFGLACTVVEGEASDVVEFTRAGVDGRLVVTADAFHLSARLGFVLGVFRDSIVAGIEENLDEVLAEAAKKPRPRRRTTS
ncbi:MAG: polyhydroxyalkanoic acid system family protein [Caldimonas sp.]